MNYAQLVQRSFKDLRVPRGTRPCFAFDLGDHETIVGVHHYWTYDVDRRATVDHHIVVWVAVSLGEPVA